ARRRVSRRAGSVSLVPSKRTSSSQDFRSRENTTPGSRIGTVGLRGQHLIIPNNPVFDNAQPCRLADWAAPAVREHGGVLTVETGWGHPLCGTNGSLSRIHLHRYWTGVRFRLVEVPVVSAALNAPLGLPILCHK